MFAALRRLPLSIKCSELELKAGRQKKASPELTLDAEREEVWKVIDHRPSIFMLMLMLMLTPMLIHGGGAGAVTPQKMTQAEKIAIAIASDIVANPRTRRRQHQRETPI